MGKITTTTFKENYYLVGIQAKIDIAKFLWYSNSFLNLNFIKTKDIQVVNKRTGQTNFFPVFISERDDIILKIVVNKSDSSFFRKDFKDFDFLLFIIPDNIENQDVVIETINAQIAKFKEIAGINNTIKLLEING